MICFRFTAEAQTVLGWCGIAREWIYQKRHLYWDLGGRAKAKDHGVE